MTKKIRLIILIVLIEFVIIYDSRKSFEYRDLPFFIVAGIYISSYLLSRRMRNYAFIANIFVFGLLCLARFFQIGLDPERIGEWFFILLFIGFTHYFISSFKEHRLEV